MSGATANDNTWKAKEQSEEARWARQKEDEQLARLRASMDLGSRPIQSTPATSSSDRRDEIEGGYGGQEELEDRYATTSGEH